MWYLGLVPAAHVPRDPGGGVLCTGSISLVPWTQATLNTATLYTAALAVLSPYSNRVPWYFLKFPLYGKYRYRTIGRTDLTNMTNQGILKVYGH